MHVCIYDTDCAKELGHDITILNYKYYILTLNLSLIPLKHRSCKRHMYSIVG